MTTPPHPTMGPTPATRHSTFSYVQIRLQSRSRGLLLLLAIAMLVAAAPAHHSHYLFVWAMEAPHGRPFIAVFEVSPGASPFGKLVEMRAVGKNAMMVHHTNYTLPPND